MPREELRVLTPVPGTIVGQKYRILRTLGEGGMGTVYEAENSLTLKRAAIKWLHPRLLEIEEASKRLLHEARAAARIRHRNVVDVYDVVTEGSSVFLVMELLEGEQLSVRLASDELMLHPSPAPQVEPPKSSAALEVVSDGGPTHSPPPESVHRADGLQREEF